MNIFISYCNKDKSTIKVILNNVRSLTDRHNLWDYQQNIEKVEMKEIIEGLSKVDLFIVFLSENSLKSPNVIQELEEAIIQNKKGNMRKLCPIMIDKSINKNSDKRIPEFIRGKIYDAIPPITAVQIIARVIEKYNSPIIN